MKDVILNWTPSVSEAVELQRVRIVDIDSLTPYGEAELGPTDGTFTAQCPEGVTVQGVVVTVRGEQEQGAVSNQLTVPFGPLAPATGLNLSVPVPTQFRR